MLGAVCIRAGDGRMDGACEGQCCIQNSSEWGCRCSRSLILDGSRSPPIHSGYQGNPSIHPPPTCGGFAAAGGLMVGYPDSLAHTTWDVVPGNKQGSRLFHGSWPTVAEPGQNLTRFLYVKDAGNPAPFAPFAPSSLPRPLGLAC